MKFKLAALLSLALLMAQPGIAATVELTPRTHQALQRGDYPLLGELEKILQQVSVLRQLPVREPVLVDLMHRQELFDLLSQQLREEVQPQEIQAEQALYTRWAMLPAGFDYLRFMLDLYTEQIGGFYDPKRRQLYLMKGLHLVQMDQELLMAHELTHALQDQHFGLVKFLKKSPQSNSDQQLAYMSLIEGDASLAAAEYIAGRTNQFSFLDVLGSVFNAARMTLSFEKLRQAPHFIRESMTFPYEQGLRFVQFLRQKRGWSWEAFHRLYRYPPNSTEQILNPQKYLDGEQPQPIQSILKDVLPATYRLISQGVLGELGWRQYFSSILESSQARRAARGWGGDQYQVLETEEKRQCFVFITQWDTAADAREFAEAYALSLEKRLPKGITTQPLSQVQVFRHQANDYSLIFCQERRCLVMENFPEFTQRNLQGLTYAFQGLD